MTRKQADIDKNKTNKKGALRTCVRPAPSLIWTTLLLQMTRHL
jgi:hypothetical protein